MLAMFEAIWASVRSGRCAAAHQGDRAMSGLLQPTQHHDRDQMADMQAVRRTVIADIGRHHALAGRLVQGFQIGALMDIATLLQDLQEL
ncbi:MAG: hypothetical protein RLZZ141_609 [Pseudomonadota bacterium]